MADLFDYMNWRGDLSFLNSPANEADYYLISKIGCPNLMDIIPGDNREIAIQEAVEAYHKFALHLISNYLTDYYKKRKT